MEPELNTENRPKIKDLLEKEVLNTEPRNFNEIVVVLTLSGNAPMIFRFSRKLSDELRKERQEFYGLNDEEQKVRTREFRINQLSQMLLECPENVPGVEYDGDWRQSYRHFLNDYEEFINWTWGQYQTKLYPKETLSNIFV